MTGTVEELQAEYKALKANASAKISDYMALEEKFRILLANMKAENA